MKDGKFRAGLQAAGRITRRILNWLLRTARRAGVLLVAGLRWLQRTAKKTGALLVAGARWLLRKAWLLCILILRLLVRIALLVTYLPRLARAILSFFLAIGRLLYTLRIPLAFCWAAVIALIAFISPYMRRLGRAINAHKPASAVVGIGAIAIIAVLYSPELTAPDPDAPADLRPAVTITALLPMTGPNADIGLSMLRGYRVALRAINEQGIKLDGITTNLTLTVYDDESDPIRAAELVHELASDPSTRMLLGPYSSAVALPAAVQAQLANQPMLVPVASPAGFAETSLKDVFLLQTRPETHLQPALELLFEQANAAGIELAELSVALAWLPDAHSAAVAAGASLALARAGVPPPKLIDLNAPDDEFGKAIKDASKAHALLVAGYSAGAAKVIDAIVAQDLEPPPVLALTHCIHARISLRAPSISDGALCLIHWQANAATPGSEPLDGTTFAAGYQHYYQSQPTHQAAAAASAILVVADAMLRVDAGTQPNLASALATTDLLTFYGHIRFDDSGFNQSKPMLMAQLQFGSYVPISPPAAATGAFQDPHGYFAKP